MIIPRWLIREYQSIGPGTKLFLSSFGTDWGENHSDFARMRGVRTELAYSHEPVAFEHAASKLPNAHGYLQLPKTKAPVIFKHGAQFFVTVAALAVRCGVLRKTSGTATPTSTRATSLADSGSQHIIASRSLGQVPTETPNTTGQYRRALQQDCCLPLGGLRGVVRTRYAQKWSGGPATALNDIATMPVGMCNKCGGCKELVLADCVCDACSRALDKQWSQETANKWVLIAPPCERRGEYPPSVPTIIKIVQKMKALEEKDGRPDAPTEMRAAAKPFPPLHWLVAVSLDAEVFALPGSLSRFIFGDITYQEMKTHWAASNVPDEIDIGPPDPEEMAKIEAGQPLPPCIRPATVEEIAHYWAMQRDRQRRAEVHRILERWGFDRQGEPFAEFVKDGMRQHQRAIHAWEEIRREFKEQGLLEGSLFDYEEEMKAIFPTDENLNAQQVSVADNASVQQSDATYSHRPLSPGRGLSQVAGMPGLKEQLLREVIGPFRDPELYRRYRVSLPNGILFYGPPGCGKTYLARSLAEELGWSFQYCRPSDVASPFIHDTVRKIRAAFSTAIEKAPSIIFIDEFEAFVPVRSTLGGHQQYKAEEVNEFLANLEGCAELKVLVIAATNEPEKIDPAVRRSGRFDKLILIPPPDGEARRAMLEFHLQGRPVESCLDTAGIAAVLEGYSASDIKLLVDEGARMALRRTALITTDTLLAAFERVPPSITAEDMQRYSGFRSRGSF